MPDLQNQVTNLKKRGMGNSDIIESLKKEGYSSQDIYDALSNTISDLSPPTPSEEMGASSSEEEPENFPSEEPSFMPTQRFPTHKDIPERQNIEEIEEIAESIIEEKMGELSLTLGDMNVWKEKTSTEIEAIKQEILRIRNQFENIQVSLIGRVEDYKKSISDVSVEVKTLSKVLENILQPLTMNVKELSRITERLKK